jgi:hypothetical protein
MAITPEQQVLSVLKIPDLDLTRFFTIVYHKNKFMSGELRFLIDFVNDFAV